MGQKTRSAVTEEWKPVKGYEGLYEVSNMGRIKSLPKVHGTVTYKYPYILKGSSDKCGYRRVSLTKGQNKKTIKIHRLVATAFIDNPDDLPQINHIDGNKKNNCVNNLEWCNCQYNVRHAVETGLRGEPYQRKKALVTDLHTGKTIEFQSYKDASLYMGHNRNYISKYITRRNSYNFIVGRYYVRA